MRQWASKALSKISAHPWCLPIVSLRSQASLRPCEKSLETGQGVQLGQGNQFGQGGQLGHGGQPAPIHLVYWWKLKLFTTRLILKLF